MYMPANPGKPQTQMHTVIPLQRGGPAEGLRTISTEPCVLSFVIIEGASDVYTNVSSLTWALGRRLGPEITEEHVLGLLADLLLVLAHHGGKLDGRIAAAGWVQGAEASGELHASPHVHTCMQLPLHPALLVLAHYGGSRQVSYTVGLGAGMQAGLTCTCTCTCRTCSALRGVLCGL